MDWESLFTSYPHIIQNIFERLDHTTLKSCLKVSKTWYQGIYIKKTFWTIETEDHPGWENEDFVSEIDDKTYCALGKAFWVIRERNPSRDLLQRNDTHPIFCAIYLDDLEMLKKLADIWIDFLDLNYPQRHLRNDFTPLHVAALEGSFEIFKYLIDFFGNKNPPDSHGRTPLHEAAAIGHFEIVEFILNNIEDNHNPDDESGLTPLHLASEHGHLKVVQILIDRKKEAGIPRSQTGITPLHLASRNGNSHIIEYFYSQKGWSLHLAAEFGHTEVFKQVMKTEGEKNPEDDLGETPLHLASRNGHFDIVHHILLNIQHNKNPPNRTGQTPLHFAAELGHFKLVEVILENIESDCNPRDLFGQTPLHCAAKNGYLDIIQQILPKIKDSDNFKDKLCQTPLHFAAESGHAKIVELLIQSIKGDKNPKDEFDRTPLHLAAKFGHIETVKVLLRYIDGDTNPKDIRGYTPLKIANDSDYPELAELLREKLPVDQPFYYLWSMFWHFLLGCLRFIWENWEQ